MMEKFGITPDDFEKMNSVFQNYIQIDSVVLYGSRVMGNFKKFSDIDISLIGTTIDLTLQNKTDFALDDLMLPYTFDIYIYKKITNSEFKEHIDSLGIEIEKAQVLKVKTVTKNHSRS